VETEDVNAEHGTGTSFLNLLPDTPQKYLGLYNDLRPQDSKTATLRNMLMVRRNYDALVSGTAACAGCGEKSILRAIAAVTEAYMRPLYHAKADRLRAKANELEKTGEQKLADLQARSHEEYRLVLFCVERRKAWRMLQSKAESRTGNTRRSVRSLPTSTPAGPRGMSCSRTPRN
jgi:pyruvate-ferredoxin/flavodoxin oxidoreductase